MGVFCGFEGPDGNGIVQQQGDAAKNTAFTDLVMERDLIVFFKIPFCCAFLNDNQRMNGGDALGEDNLVPRMIDDGQFRSNPDNLGFRQKGKRDCVHQKFTGLLRYNPGGIGGIHHLLSERADKEFIDNRITVADIQKHWARYKNQCRVACRLDRFIRYAGVPQQGNAAPDFSVIQGIFLFDKIFQKLADLGGKHVTFCECDFTGYVWWRLTTQRQ